MSKPEENRRPQTLRSRLPIWASTSLQPRRQPSLIPPPTQQPMGAAPSHPLLSLEKPSPSLSKPAPPSEPLKNLETKAEESKNAETRDTKDRKPEKNDLPQQEEDQKAEIFEGKEEEKKKNEDDDGDQKEKKKELFKENVEEKREGEASATEKKKNKEDEEGDKKEIDDKDNGKKKKALFSENMEEEREGEASASKEFPKRSLREKEGGHVTRDLPKEVGHVTRELPKEIREGVSKLLHGFKLEERSNGGQGTTVITLAGDNRGATMTVNGKEEEDGKKKGWVLNSNVQGVNNSILKGSCCRVELPSWENEGLKLGYAPMEGKEKKGGRRCLRALLMESSDEEGENPRRRHGYRCVCDEGKKGSA